MVPVGTAWGKTRKKPIGGKWVDRNKKDKANPLIRSRYVAKEINTYKDESLFAATPPLEALRVLVSSAATRKGAGRPDTKILLIDVRKAHLHAEVVREVFVELPPELAKKHPGMCWKLNRCLWHA